MGWSHFIDVLNFLMAGGAIYFTWKSWKRQDEKDKKDEERYHEQQVKSLSLKGSLTKKWVGILTDYERQSLFVEMEIVNDGYHDIIFKEITLAYYRDKSDIEPYRQILVKDSSLWKFKKLCPKEFILIKDPAPSGFIDNSLIEIMVTDTLGDIYNSERQLLKL